MKATATDLARDTANILARTEAGQTVEIKRRGKTIAVIRKRVGIKGRELARRFRNSPLRKGDGEALRAAIEEASKALAPL